MLNVELTTVSFIPKFWFWKEFGIYGNPSFNMPVLIIHSGQTLLVINQEMFVKHVYLKSLNITVTLTFVLQTPTPRGFSSYWSDKVCLRTYRPTDRRIDRQVQSNIPPLLRRRHDKKSIQKRKKYLCKCLCHFFFH